MKRVALFLFSIVVAWRAGATAQAPEILKMDGKTYDIHSNPLTPVLAANPGKLPESPTMSTGLWRGYLGTWAVRDNRLFLEDVQILTGASIEPDTPESERYRSVMKNLFGDGKPRVATWYTGNLVVPTGELVDYVHMGYGSTFSSYVVLTVVKGVIQKRRELNAEQFTKFRRAQYEAYRKTPEYAKVLALAKKGDSPMSDERTEEFVYQVASEEYLSRIFEDRAP